ncbi:MAG: sterol desaturase family protein [Myxococcota bacterium]
MMIGPSESSPRMFENDLFDLFSRTPWYFVPIIWGPVVTLLAWWGYSAGVAPALLLGQALIGLFVWTFAEYWLHRTLFHWIPDAPWGEKFHFLLHGVHHVWHKDALRLVMPPGAAVVLYALFYVGFQGLAYLTAPVANPSWFYGFYAGFTFGYIVYDVTHYFIHHARVLGTNWFMRQLLVLRKHHLAHHHNPKDAERKFGVSATLWDHVFGTA